MSAPLTLGLAGRFANAWINSKLTPLIIVASLLLGGLALLKLPREEEPQIIVPMIDVFVEMPGASAREVEERVTKPLEKLLWEISGVEYIYSTSSPGMSSVIVRFLVGQNEENSIVRLNQKLAANLDRIPPGASPPLIKPRSIDDVPILALTIWSERYGDAELRRMAAQMRDVVQQTPDVSALSIIGGQPRQINIQLDPARLASYNLSPLHVLNAVGLANHRLPAGDFSSGNQHYKLEVGQFLRTAEDVRKVSLSAPTPGLDKVVFLSDVATVTDGVGEPTQLVRFSKDKAFHPAVTLAVSKRKGTNAVDVSEAVLHRLEPLLSKSLPADVHLAITRNYGESAKEKSNELLFHMFIAVFSVSLLIAITLGRRESAVVFLAIPVTLALTLAVFYFYGFTLNRITLFALIFSIGILVDDAIVVLENIVRHWRMPTNQTRPSFEVAVEAVDEVGNPTILATLAVVAAILPMAFVGGLMGPYMRPIPIGATAAMLFSLLVALSITPWAAIRILKPGSHHEGESEDFFTLQYRRFMGSLLHHAPRRWAFLGLVMVLLLASMTLVYFGAVKVKMLPFDNKSEFQVIIDMPNGTTLEQTALVTQLLAQAAQQHPAVVDVQTYAGTASPYNFNGLVRHYYLRQGPNVADIQVNLKPKSERGAQSHEIAKEVRNLLLPVAKRYQARVKVAEVPPGPPVLQTLVAEVYGETLEGRIAIARRFRDLFLGTPGVVDVDWYVEDDQPKYQLRIDSEKAALHGVSVQQLAQTVQLATAGRSAGLLHVDSEMEDIPLILRLDRASRSDLQRILNLKVQAKSGGAVALSEVMRIDTALEDKSIYHKNLMPVTYVTADIAGQLESPVYAIFKLGAAIEQMKIPQGYQIEQFVASLPTDSQRYAMKWDGEWHITFEVFRDLGLAFAAVLVLIYGLLVGWFRSFLTPFVIMAAIPFSLVGILPAHGLMGAFFSATSMIGFIAGAGIVVRNSIILVDFIQLRLSEGMPLDEAVIDAGAVRFRPMMLTAAAVVAGASVILFDPIFQGLAIALMAGEIASLLLSRMTVPVLFYLLNKKGSSLHDN